MILIPSQNKKIIQTNRGDLFGTFWSSFGLDLQSNKGRIRLSPRLNVSSSTEFISTLTTAPCAFKRYNNLYYTISGTRVHVTNSDNITASWDVESTSNYPTTCDVEYSDTEVFNNELYVSTKSNSLYYFNGGWSSPAITVGASDVGPHPMCKYGNLLYYLRAQNIIYSINSSHTATLLLTLGGGEEMIVWMKPSSNRIWLGTLNLSGGKGRVYEWDGASTQTSRFYEINAQGVISCVIKDDVPWVMDSRGRLLVFNGGTFIEQDRLPLNEKLLLRATSTINNRFIHPNGMAVIDDEVCMLINNVNSDSTATINENLPSGVWSFNDDNGLYHRYSFSYHDDDDAITTITDYGQNRISVAGALQSFNVNAVAETANGSFLAGATYYTNASSTRSAVFVNDKNDTVQKYGYFVTTWIDSANLKDSWNNYYLKFKQFLDSADKIIVKYRTLETTSQEVSITWTSTSTFTTTTSILGKESYEVEVIQGTGSGKTAHITSIDWNNTVYTAHLDDTFTGVTTGTAKVRIQKWTKLNEITGQTMESFKGSINKISERIQLKVCMQFTGKDEVFQLIIINNSHSKLE